MATLAEIPANTVQPGPRSSTAESFWTTSELHEVSSHAASPKEEEDVNKAKRREARKSLPPAPLNAESRNHAPGILDRRKSVRPKSVRIERVTSGGVTCVRSPKGSIPRIPIIVDAIPPLLPQLVQSPVNLQSPSVMASPRSETRLRDGDVSPLENDAFTDAPETSSIVPETAESIDPSRKSAIERGIGIAIGEDQIPANGDHTQPSLPSRTIESIGEKAVPKFEPAQISASSPPKQTVQMAMSGDGDVLAGDDKRLSSASLSPDLRPTDALRNISPTRMLVRPLSPPKLSPGLSGDTSTPNSRPSSASTSPQLPTLSRTASTRIGGFLSRMGSIRKPSKTPPILSQERPTGDRRNTSQSIASLASNGGESLATIEDGEENLGGLKSPTLQDQFQTLRKQQEQSLFDLNTQHPAALDESATPTERTASDAGVAHSTSSSRETIDYKTSRSSSTPGPLKSPPLDPTLPPGTASGLAAGPAEEPRPVDWDLWQTVVYEGPAAVARTSGEELNRAISSGIPAAIRGVVWQVLADSKSPELEGLYRTLKSRGAADVEQPPSNRPAPPSRDLSQILFNNSESVEKDSEVASSRSSIHSEKSTAATSTTPPTSVLDEDADARAKLLAEKAKREAAALSKLEKAIKRDLGSRTSFSKYAQAAGLQDGLFGLCKAYALFDESVGYAQGINFIAMPLLFNMSEEEAFTLLVRLMSKYDVRNMFTGDMAGLHLRLYQFERLLEDHDPALYCHLRRKNVGPQLYATQWFLTLFAYRFPLQLVLRVYDLIFSQGLPAILKFGLVLMERNRDALLEMKDMGQLTNFLKEKLFDVYIDKSPSAFSLLEGGFFGSVSGGADKELYRADEMVRDACNVEISEATLAMYTAEWEESQRQTREREAELEHLRTTNATLTVRVKSLEDRTQQQDLEHVTIAGDVVRIKVENDKLLDENEGLKIKIEELQKLVDTQPAELEAKFKEEMSRVLERNSVVQSENRVLKEEQEEMERQLVDIKMKHALAQQDHETLSRKWSNVQAMLNSK